ncbi:MAG: hypothetical protein V4590_14520 [Bacteroidota bacterium]
MQHSNVLVASYAPNNTNEDILKGYNEDEYTRGRQTLRQGVFRNFRVHSAEEAELFVNMFEIVYDDSYSILKKQYPLLSTTEGIVLAFLYIGLPELKISRNMGFSIEDLRCHIFIISQKLKMSTVQLHESINATLR